MVRCLKSYLRVVSDVVGRRRPLSVDVDVNEGVVFVDVSEIRRDVIRVDNVFKRIKQDDVDADVDVVRRLVMAVCELFGSREHSARIDLIGSRGAMSLKGESRVEMEL